MGDFNDKVSNKILELTGYLAKLKGGGTPTALLSEVVTEVNTLHRALYANDRSALRESTVALAALCAIIFHEGNHEGL